NPIVEDAMKTRVVALALFLIFATRGSAADATEIRYRIMSCSPWLIQVNFPDKAPQVNDSDFAKALRKFSGDWSREWDKDNLWIRKDRKSKTVIDLTAFKAWLNEALRTKAQAIVQLPG